MYVSTSVDCIIIPSKDISNSTKHNYDSNVPKDALAERHVAVVELFYLNIVLSGCTFVTVGFGLYVNSSVDSLMALSSKDTTNGSDVLAGASVVWHMAVVSLKTSIL